MVHLECKVLKVNTHCNVKSMKISKTFATNRCTIKESIFFIIYSSKTFINMLSNPLSVKKEVNLCLCAILNTFYFCKKFNLLLCQ